MVQNVHAIRFNETTWKFGIDSGNQIYIFAQRENWDKTKYHNTGGGEREERDEEEKLGHRRRLWLI